MTAYQIVRAAVDAAGQAGGRDEVEAIAARGAGAMAFSDEDWAVLLDAHGSPADVLYAVQLEAQRRVSAFALDALLAMHWPVDRLAAQPIGETAKQAIEAGLLYREDVGNGWVRYGLTDAGVTRSRHLDPSRSEAGQR